MFPLRSRNWIFAYHVA